MRRDAALYEVASPPTGKAGRPGKQGARLATLTKLARAATGYTEVEARLAGTTGHKAHLDKDVLWYRVCRDALVCCVVVRDPSGIEPGDLFTTDLVMSPAEVVEIYAGHWSIEMCFRDVKRGVEAKSPKDKGPERAAGLSFWLHGVIWVWYLEISGGGPSFSVKPWYSAEAMPFVDAMVELRRTLWRERISPTSGLQPLTSKKLTYSSKRSPLLHRGYPPTEAPSARLRKSTQSMDASIVRLAMELAQAA
jgi:hypothetical protein